jgi:hypothetical protein
LERDLRDFPWHRCRVDLHVDRPDADSDHLGTPASAASTHMSATDAAPALSSCVPGAGATMIDKERR